ncbi:MAG TPA: hypothetical protein VNV44_13590 [Solirubrobacteraceae bacterium]|jgi:hypothetical protein|nr:hypothetical protein [Solirubrobacteraceae bacterium]
MFVGTTLLYPCALAGLCLGVGLLVDRLAGGWVPGALLAPLGAAGLIGLSQLATIPAWLAPATPWLMLALATSGLALGRARARALLTATASGPLPALASAVVYLLALAPVLIAGRTTFSSFGALSDSAVHMAGADYLIHHGQNYGHLDLRNSYGQFIKGYYGTSYPSGADTLFGGSALLLGLPLIWAFQPFNAFMLALGFGPAWLLARYLGLRRGWALLAGVTAMLPALVYAYELLGSIKEITTLPLLLACGCLVSRPQVWIGRGARGAVPLALLFAGGVSALGPAFGAWALASLIVLLPVVLAGRSMPPRGNLLVAGLAGALVLLVAALPTWKHLGAALRVAGTIASTSNSGNLHEPLHSSQVLGVWLDGSYKLTPAGGVGRLSDILTAIVGFAVVLGAVNCVRRRAWGVGGWIAAMVLTWLVISRTLTTWASAKTLVLTSPAVMLAAWAGVALLRELRPRLVAIVAAGSVAAAIAVGVFVSDELQYNTANLAPTARYEELASVNRRFAGGGPTLFTDFDEYSLYELRELDVGTPNFAYFPPALASVAGGYGRPFTLDELPPAALSAYPLIVTRRDPAASRPPRAYRLVWQGTYYMVWRRERGTAAAVTHTRLSGTGAQRCAAIADAARAAGSSGSLTGALAPRLVTVALARSRRPAGWGSARHGVVMKRAGTLRASFSIPATGGWDLWLRGRLMPRIGVGVDGRPVGSVAGQLSGNSLVSALAPPIKLHLIAGLHSLEIHRASPSLAPGDRGAAVLTGVLLSPAAEPAAGTLVTLPSSAWRQLCPRSLQWVESYRRG